MHRAERERNRCSRKLLKSLDRTLVRIRFPPAREDLHAATSIAASSVFLHLFQNEGEEVIGKKREKQKQKNEDEMRVRGCH